MVLKVVECKIKYIIFLYISNGLVDIEYGNFYLWKY